MPDYTDDDDDPDSADHPRSKTLVVESQESPTNRSRAVLTVSTGPDTGRVFTIPAREVVTVGRGENCTFKFDDASISTVHARIVLIGGVYMLNDNKSTNGSFVNEVRVASPVALNDGDRVRLGPNCLLRFSLVDESEELALKKMYEAALFDGLTRVFNRKYLEERLDSEIAFAVRHQTEFSAIMIDVDFFKKVNDTYGHLAGDEVLKSTAKVLAAGLRTEDLIARYGGEEFVVLTRGINVRQCCVLADRLRWAVSQTVVPYEQHRIV
ncbi:MAG: GGDEF domain-containing protein, partial [Polyangiaceae bacterium]